MTALEWQKIKTDYIENSQEFAFDYGDNMVINLCWSLDDELPYGINVCTRQRRWLLPDRLITIRSEKYPSKCELLKSFKIDGRTLDELFDMLE